jgi:hypothetical protein
MMMMPPAERRPREIIMAMMLPTRLDTLLLGGMLRSHHAIVDASTVALQLMGGADR